MDVVHSRGLGVSKSSFSITATILIQLTSDRCERPRAETSTAHLAYSDGNVASPDGRTTRAHNLARMPVIASDVTSSRGAHSSHS